MSPICVSGSTSIPAVSVCRVRCATTRRIRGTRWSSRSAGWGYGNRTVVGHWSLTKAVVRPWPGPKSASQRCPLGRRRTPNARGSLASRRESAGVRNREAQVFVGIDGSVIDADFVVEVGTGAAAAQTDISDGISAVHLLSCSYGEVCQVSVAGGEAVAVVNHDGPPIAAQEIGKDHHTVGRGYHRLSVRRTDIHSAMERAFAIERVDSFSERPGHGALYRPK